jgi:hypothetical protein
LKNKEGYMTKAKSIARIFSNYFFDTGQYINQQAEETVAPTALETHEIPDPLRETKDVSSNVHAVGYGTDAGQESCYFYVRQSGARHLDQLLPETWKGVNLNVIPIGNMSVQPQKNIPTSTNQSRIVRSGGRTLCGTSVGLAKSQTTGTLGALVHDKAGDLFGLSNNHVLGTCNHTSTGHPIVSPSVLDESPRIKPRHFANFESLIELRSGHHRHVPQQKIDAAIGHILKPEWVSSMQGNRFDTPNSTRLPVIRERVKKVGRTTGLTFGTIQSQIPVLAALPYKTPEFSATVYFQNIFVVEADPGTRFALGGDSGSLIVSEDHQHALGLLFAATTDGKLGWFCSMHNVLKSFGGLTLVSSHGL